MEQATADGAICAPVWLDLVNDLSYAVPRGCRPKKVIYKHACGNPWIEYYNLAGF